VDPRVAPFVEAARGYIRRALSVELDLSPESLAYVDHYVRSTSADKSAPLEDDVLRLASAALGAYFGEVLIAAFGGDWIIGAQDDAHPERWKLELTPPMLSMHPAALAASALAGAEVAGYDDRIAPPFRDAAALQQLLESSAPVDTELYYSLTGRLEAIEQMRGFLAEIDRRRQAGPPSGSEDPEEDELN
jgi:hypothetical protein